MDADKLTKVVMSCTNLKQLECANRYAEFYLRQSPRHMVLSISVDQLLSAQKALIESRL